MTTGVGDYPGSATRDSLYWHNGTTDGTFTVTVPGVYTGTIKFWASRIDAGNTPRSLEIRKSGTTEWSTIDALNAVGYTGPNSVVLALTSGANVFETKVKAGSTFGYIGIMDINLSLGS